MLLFAACGDDVAPPAPPDGGGGSDASIDAGALDAGRMDAGVDLGACADEDGDGSRSVACGGDDCDDADPLRYPGATELCDAADRDEDCDPETYGFRDGDGDGFPDVRCCNGLSCGDDCNDMRPGVNPVVPEVCNGIDDDCDGATDEDLLAMIYPDADRDGFGAGTPTPGCPGAPGTVTNADDCDDARAATNPGAMEACDGTADDDCDGTIDEGCTCTAGEMRGCGSSDVGECVAGTQTCIDGLWAGCTGTGPGTETCNGLDDDCDGMTDEGLLVSGCFADRDADGYGAGTATTQCLDMTRAEVAFCPAGYSNVASPVDCNDGRADTSPGATEFCDEIDNDCDGFVDDVAGAGAACTVGVGACAVVGVRACSGATLSCMGAPGTPTAEVCNGVDDDCDGVVDDGIEILFDCRRDTDGDGFGVGEPTTLCADVSRPDFGRCPAGYARAAQLDCNDDNAAIRPTATDICNGIDDDCDGFTDDVVPVLTALTVSCGTLSPAFDSATTTYRVNAPAGTTSCVVQATTACPSALALTVDGVAGTSEVGVAVPVTAWFRPISVNVRATDGTTRRYDVVVIRGSTYVKASNTGASDGFGCSLSLSADGSTLAVGARGEGSSATGVGGDPTSNAASGSGAVYVFRRTAGAWAQEAYIKASNTGAGDQFGHSVTLSADGALLAISAPGEDSSATGIDGDQTSNATTGSGAVYLFRRAVAGAWTQEAYIKASNTGAGDQFGASLALSSDGSTLAVGANSEDASATGIDGDASADTATDSGAVYVFRRTAGAWAQEAYVKASNTGANDFFGRSVALSADGTTLAIGADLEDSIATGVGGDQTNNASQDSGAVYVFRRSVTGAWTQEVYIKASNTGLVDSFGGAIALSADGATLAVGAYREDSTATGINGDQTSDPSLPSEGNSGAVYVFQRAAGAWAQEAYVKASNTGAADYFGWSVSLSADGAALAVGATGEASNSTVIGGSQTNNSASNSGAVYTFRRAETGTWTQEAYVKASNTGASDQFGRWIVLSGDGSTLAVGTNFEDSSATGIGGDQTNNAAADSGAVYVF